eukprot:259601_1
MSVENIVTTEASNQISDELHRAVFKNNLDSVVGLVASFPPVDLACSSRDALKHPINAKDHRGNTALHMAILLGHDDIARELAKAGAFCLAKNSGRWNCAQECVSISNRELLKDLLQANRRMMDAKIAARGPRMKKGFESTPDFYGEIHWKFSSWIPFVTRFCPSDTFRIWKKGRNIRVDISLVDVEKMSWKKGHISFIFQPNDDPKSPNKLFLVDHVKKTIQVITKSGVQADKYVDDDVDRLMESEIVRPDFNPETVRFDQKKSWLGYPKHEEINAYDCNMYNVRDMKFDMLYRTEHFTPELIEKRKKREAVHQRHMKRLKEGAASEDSNREEVVDETEISTRSAESCEYSEVDFDDPREPCTTESESTKRLGGRINFPPYVPPKISFDVYFNGKTGDGVLLGKKPKVERRSNAIKAGLWISEDFPFKKSDILPILDIISPSSPQVKKLKSFIELEMPPGFPVRLEIPLFHVLTATVTFQKFVKCSADDSLFELPKSHKHVKFERHKKRSKKRLSASKSNSIKSD